MIIPHVKATITDDFRLEFAIPRQLELVLRTIGAGVAVRVDVKKWFKQRTTKQNSMQWGPDYSVILLFLAEKGEVWRADDIHDFHKKRFLGYEESAMAKGLLRPRSTTTLNTKEMSDFREDYCRFWADCGLYIPDPERED